MSSVFKVISTWPLGLGEAAQKEPPSRLKQSPVFALVSGIRRSQRLSLKLLPNG
jgi:hypothetical protein